MQTPSFSPHPKATTATQPQPTAARAEGEVGCSGSPIFKEAEKLELDTNSIYTVIQFLKK